MTPTTCWQLRMLQGLIEGFTFGGNWRFVGWLRFGKAWNKNSEEIPGTPKGC